MTAPSFIDSIDPWCPVCDQTFDSAAEVIGNSLSDGEVHLIIECTSCDTPWEILIAYDHPITAGVEVQITPAILEMGE